MIEIYIGISFQKLMNFLQRKERPQFKGKLVMDNATNPKKFSFRKGNRGSHTIIKDRDLQIHMPVVEETNPTYQSADFKSRTVPFSERLSPSIIHESEAKNAMAEAKNSYDSMMQFRQQLKQAYEELIKCCTLIP